MIQPDAKILSENFGLALHFYRAGKKSVMIYRMIIDFHTHLFNDKMAAPVMELLSKRSNQPYFAPATRASLLEVMKKSGVDKSVVLNVATKENQHENLLRFARDYDSDKLISFGSVVPTSVYALEYVWKISDEGLRGIKFHPALQRFDADDPQVFPIYDLARALNLVVVFHAGWDPSFPDEIRAAPEMLVNIVKNFPGLRVVAAHLGGLKLARDVFENIAGRADLYFDTAFTADPWLDRGLFRDIIRRHGAERILFGSDFPWHLPSMEIDLIRSLDISEEEKRMILGENAERLIGI